MALTKSQINRLGERLRHQQTIDAEDLQRLQDFRSSYDAPMAQAQNLIRDQLRIESTSRLKTINTIIEKLRREKTRLAEMQDIAGLRIVEDMGLGAQDHLVERIRGLLPGARRDDRRQRPSHGYRAVHIIPEVDGRLVEIQVRTRLQDTWAQSMERLADEAGREVRYGAVPAAWASAIETWRALSETMGEFEEYIESIRLEGSQLPPPHRVPHGQRELQLHRARLDARLKSLQADVAKACDMIRDGLKEWVEKKPKT